MGKNKQITPRKLAVISQYIKDGLSISEISRRLKIPRTSVSNIVRRLRQTGSVDVGRRTGRPRITTSRDDISLLNYRQ